MRPAGWVAARLGFNAVKALLADPELIQQRPELLVHLRVADPVGDQHEVPARKQGDRWRCGQHLAVELGPARVGLRAAGGEGGVVAVADPSGAVFDTGNGRRWG